MRSALILIALGFAAPLVARAEEPLYTCEKLPATAKLRLSLKPESTIGDLGLWLSGFTCKNVVFSAEADRRARITIIAPNELNPAQAYKLFQAALLAQDLLVIEKGDTVIIKDAPGAKRCPAADDAPPAAAAPAPPAPAPATPEEDPAIAAGIKVIDDTHSTITSAARKRLMEDRNVEASARVIPSMKNGKANGFKITAIRPASAYARLGLRNDDVIVSINKLPLSSPQEALDAYDKVKSAKTVVIGILRDGEPVNLEITIIP